MISIKRMLVSCYDKSGLIDFVKPFFDKGVEIISTGGTKRYLKENGIDVLPVEEITGFPEILNGRVKTLHPKIFGGILADKTKDEHLNEIKEHYILPVDMVVVNLYPFVEVVSREHSFEEAIENIDIGGPSLIRAAAKNHNSVVVLVDKEDYPKVLEEFSSKGGVGYDLSLELAQKAFAYTSYYDSQIANYFLNKIDKRFPKYFTVSYKLSKELRYGENPHQKAGYYIKREKEDIVKANMHGKELSYNNLIDIEGAIELIREFDDEYACCIIKHTNPCGVGIGDSLKEAYKRALSSDPVSAFGSIIAFSKELDKDTALELKDLFVEVVIAPGFSSDALDILKEKKNLRIIDLNNLDYDLSGDFHRSLIAGMLIQDRDYIGEDWNSFKVVTKRSPTEEEFRALRFGWLVVKHVKSNAIVLSSDLQTIGIGAGQMSRVDSLKIAIAKAKEFGFDLKGKIMASDAFFPFPDSIEIAHKEGITAVIQPGGSIRDEEVIKACDDFGMAMIFTGRRHFRH